MSKAHFWIFKCLHIVIAKGGRLDDRREAHPADPHTMAGLNSAADCGNVFQELRQLGEPLPSFDFVPVLFES